MQVEWEEYWWEASDWAGMKELGAEKSGCSADGAAWRETWREAIAFDPFTGEPTVERTAHKWAHDAKASHLLPMSGGTSKSSLSLVNSLLCLSRSVCHFVGHLLCWVKASFMPC